MPSESVRDARDRYLAARGLGVASYTKEDFVVPVAGIRLRFPNPGLLPLHDLHHVATGYGTSVIGEAEISAFELRTGCKSRIVFILCVGAIAIALFVSPRRVWRAWKRAKGARSLYYAEESYDTLLSMDVVELRRRMNLPEELA